MPTSSGSRPTRWTCSIDGWSRRTPAHTRGAVAAAILTILLFRETFAIERRVRAETPTGTLYGTLELPAGQGPFLVGLLVAGSGPTDRDGNQPLLKNDSLKLLGQALVGRGIAVLRYDKRGVGESATAAPREDGLRFETLVADVVSWIVLLRRDARFVRIAVIGHSEGALIGLLAAKEANADAFVSVAGAGRGAADLIRGQLRTTLPPLLRTRSDQILDELMAGRPVPDVPDALSALFRPSVQPYLISWFKYEPTREIAALKAPALIVQGTTDLQVPVDDARRLASARPGATLCLVEGMNHVLKHATRLAEQRAAYGDPTVPIEPRAVEEIVAFLTRTAGDR